MHDVAIVGGGPAGLSAALILGRCRRRVVVFDAGEPRNGASQGLHGYLTRDGTPPMQLRDLGRAEVARYPTVSIRDVRVTRVERGDGRFGLSTGEGLPVIARILLLATGRVDLVPDKPGFRALYGRGVYHCPVCDGWEHAGEPWVVYGQGENAAEFAIELRAWSDQLRWCPDGKAAVNGRLRERLARHWIAVDERPIRTLEPGGDGRLARVVFADGGHHPCTALFFDAGRPQRSSFAEDLGAEVDASGGILCNQHAATSVPGLFVAGNVRCGVHLAITAAAEGAEAAIAIHKALLAHDLA